MNFGSIKQIKLQLSKQWDRGKFLKSHASGENLFPLETAIKGPTASEMVNDFDNVRNWIKEIKTSCETHALKLVWKEVNHRQLGRNSIPARIYFPTIAELAGFLGKKTELKVFEKGLSLLGNTFPSLLPWAAQHPFELIKITPDIERLLSIVSWRIENQHPDIYLRQLSLPGVDTKFIEVHKKVIGQWLDILLDKDQICEEFSGTGKFEARYGFLARPAAVRFRILDPDLRIGNFSDLTVRADEFAGLSLPVKYAFIIENDITALALPPVKDAMVLFGRGYNFDHLTEASWLKEKELWYWGDIDTHGFAILNQFRTKFPSVKSFLMDRETLMDHRSHWGVEKNQTTAELPNLSRKETLLYDELRYNKIQEGLRLEQEFIDFSRVMKFIVSFIVR